MVQWERLDQPLFDRLIEGMANRRHLEDDVRVFDGRGGDGGLDIHVVTRDGRELVYQLKHFPEGFDTKAYSQRRQQIRRSLSRALETCPHLDEWILVAPCTPTKSGWTFISALQAEHSNLKITFTGRAQLDSEWVAKHPDVVRAILARDEALEKAALYQAEKTLLGGGLPDLLERVGGLDRVSREAHPDWWWQVASHGELQVAQLRAHHPRAAEVSPISIDFNVANLTDEPSVKQFTKAMRFGAIEPVHLPGKFISDFVVNGPEIVRSANSAGKLTELVLEPLLQPNDPRPFVLELTSEDGATTTHQGLMIQIAQGPDGVTMRQTFQGGAVTLTWRLPATSPAQAEVEVNIRLGHANTANQMYRTTGLLQAWSRCARARMLTEDGGSIATLGPLTGALDPALLADVTVLHEFSEDMDFIEREIGKEFRIPEELSVMDRIDTRILRLILQGHLVCFPEFLTLPVTLTPAALEKGDLAEDRPLVLLAPYTDPTEKKSAASPTGAEWHLVAVSEQGPSSTVVLNEQIGWYFPRMYLEDAEGVKRRLDRGETVKARWKPKDGLRPRVYLPRRLARNDQHLAPEPWGLHGVDEVPELSGDE